MLVRHPGWQREIYVRAVDGDGEPRGRETRLTSNPAESCEPSIAAFPGGRVAVP